jgi:predicted lipoprotein with Yx(FWY)xxD motif
MSTRFRFCIMVAAIFISIAFAAAQDYTVTLKDGYMLNESGWTLYYSLNDAPGNGISNCIGDCSSLWPPFHPDIIRVQPPLSTSDFKTISRNDGKLQTIYKGWPLYYYTKDKKLGDAKGDREKGIWFAINYMKFPPAYGSSNSLNSLNSYFFFIRSFLHRFD